MEKQSLFNISAELNDIFLQIEEEGGVITEEIIERLSITQDNLKDKLNDYRKAYSLIASDVDACKKEEARIACIRKTKENNANRLKGAMLEAVINFGDTGKSGNKVIDLIDSKLYTRKNKCIDIDETALLAFKDIFFERLKELYDNDLLDTNDPNVESIDVEGFLDVINSEFTCQYPELAEDIINRKGHLFTIQDLNTIKFKFETTMSCGEMLNKSSFRFNNAYFDNSHKTDVSQNIDKRFIKNIIETHEDNNIFSFANVNYNDSLIIK